MHWRELNIFIFPFGAFFFKDLPPITDWTRSGDWTNVPGDPLMIKVKVSRQHHLTIYFEQIYYCRE